MNRPFYEALFQTLTAGDGVVLATILSGALDGRVLTAQKAFLCGGRTVACDSSLSGFWQILFDQTPLEPLPRVVQADGFRVLLEGIAARPALVVCGGGHIAVPLARLGAMLGFDVTVIDDRAEFANAARFPTAETVVCAPFSEAMERLAYDGNGYFVIITRGHADDRFCLERILNRRFRYVGMIGSRRKVDVVMAELERQGYSRETLERVHAPIGLKIGARTPAEIAVCIAAELVQTRSGSSGGALAPEALDALARGVPAVLATIIEKQGSSPRGVGAKLLADADGRLYGSVGGGAGEAAVIARAKDVLASGEPCTLQCDMTNDDARKAGMVCGGTITVLLDPIL